MLVLYQFSIAQSIAIFIHKRWNKLTFSPFWFYRWRELTIITKGFSCHKHSPAAFYATF